LAGLKRGAVLGGFKHFGRLFPNFLFSRDFFIKIGLALFGRVKKRRRFLGGFNV
jgi:hypothetical protein